MDRESFPHTGFKGSCCYTLSPSLQYPRGYQCTITLIPPQGIYTPVFMGLEAEGTLPSQHRVTCILDISPGDILCIFSRIVKVQWLSRYIRTALSSEVKVTIILKCCTYCEHHSKWAKQTLSLSFVLASCILAWREKKPPYDIELICGSSYIILRRSTEVAGLALDALPAVGPHY